MTRSDGRNGPAATYKERLRGRSAHLGYALAYPIRETFRSNPKYYLVFATRSMKAIPIMNDILCSEEDALFERTEAVRLDGQSTFFGSLRDDELQFRLAGLTEEIHRFGVAHQGSIRPKIVEYFIMEKFGQFKVKHYHNAIAKLVKERRAKFANGRQNNNDPITFM